jgi:hypothetical protein
MIQVFQDKSTALSCSDNTVTTTAFKFYPKLIQPTSYRHILFTCSVGVEPSPLLLQHQKGPL